jgi:hypothetical protein
MSHHRRLVATRRCSGITITIKPTSQATAGPTTDHVASPAADVLSPANARSA